MFGHQTTAGDIVRGMLAGAIGGAVGSIVMNRMPKEPAPGTEGAAAGRAREAKKEAAAESGKEPTVKVAEATSRKLFDHELTEQEGEVAGSAVHVGYGATIGALYGGLAEVWPNIKIGMGMGYGMAAWALGSEAAVPALGLAPSPTRVSAEKHADNLAAHLCFGLTLDVVRRVAKIAL